LQLAIIRRSNQENKVAGQAETSTLAREVRQTNIQNAERLKYLYESAKGGAKDVAKGTEVFLDALLAEYEQLRNPNSFRPAQTNQQKICTRATKYTGS
jgi:hypothetical protein